MINNNLSLSHRKALPISKLKMKGKNCLGNKVCLFLTHPMKQTNTPCYPKLYDDIIVLGIIIVVHKWNMVTVLSDSKSKRARRVTGWATDQKKNTATVKFAYPLDQLLILNNKQKGEKRFDWHFVNSPRTVLWLKLYHFSLTFPPCVSYVLDVSFPTGLYSNITAPEVPEN